MRDTVALRQLLGLAVLSAAVAYSASFVRVVSQAETIDTTLLIANAAPTFVSVMTSSEPFGAEDYADGKIDTLVPGGEMPLYLTGVVEDANTREEIESVSAVFFRSGVDGGADCSPNNGNDCYVVPDCDLDVVGGMTDIQYRFNCPIKIQYYADATEMGGEFPDERWIVAMSVTDVHGAVGTDLSQTREIQTLLALDFQLAFDYGELSLGTETDESNAASQWVSQAGNDRADTELSYSVAPGYPSFGGYMDCAHTGGTGAIPSEYQQWSVVPNHYGGDGSYALSDSPEVAPLDIGYRHGENPAGVLHWNIKVPDSGVSGTCTGSIVVSAVSH